MTAMAEKLGYKAGFALDLTTTDENGQPWDLSIKAMQERAMELLDKEAPWLLVVSPPVHHVLNLAGLLHEQEG